MNNSLKLDVLYQFNNKYAPYAGVSLTSLFENNIHFKELNIYVFDDIQDSISNENRGKLEILANKYGRKIEVLQTEKLIHIMKKVGIPPYRGSYTTNMKMFFSYLIPRSENRLLYIDSDTVINGKLDELVSLDFENKCLAMVMDSLAQTHKYDIGLTQKDSYYNAGVILFNVDQWLKLDCIESIIKHAKNVRAHYPAPDQDLINVNIRKNILKIRPAFNFQPIHLEYSPSMYLKTFRPENYYTEDILVESLREPIIYHCFRYLGEFPWHENNCHPFNNIFDKYLHKSLWSDYKKEPADVGKILKFEKFLYKIMPRSIFIKLFKFAHRKFIRKANKLSLQNKNDKRM